MLSAAGHLSRELDIGTRCLILVNYRIKRGWRTSGPLGWSMRLAFQSVGSPREIVSKLSNRLAFAALAVGCLLAAGGGGYLASRWSAPPVAASDAPAASMKSSSAAVQATEIVSERRRPKDQQQTHYLPPSTATHLSQGGLKYRRHPGAVNPAASRAPRTGIPEPLPSSRSHGSERCAHSV
mgnify:CR=1 FL=1